MYTFWLLNMPYSKVFSPKVCIVDGSPLHTLVFVLIWAAGKEFKFGEFVGMANAPSKINILNPKSWRFSSDDFPFQLGDFLGSM